LDKDDYHIQIPVEEVGDDKNSFLFGVGRIYGITSTDASSYIARSLFYDKITSEIYGSDYNSGIFMASSDRNSNDAAQYLKMNTAAGGYDSVCYTTDGSGPGDPDGYREGCEYQYGPLPEDFEIFHRRKITSYNDHGSQFGWMTLSSDPNSENFLPWMDLSLGYGNACDTNDFFVRNNGVYSFGMSFVRRGGIAYYGATSISSWNTCEKWMFKKMTSRDYSLAEGINDLLINTCTYAVFTDYILLGDPTLRPGFKEVVYG
jgi:hypothetical protein